MTLSHGDGAVFAPIVENAARAGAVGDSLGGAVMFVASNFRDPAAAMQWLDHFPVPESVASARANIFGDFVEADSAAASEWLAALPPDAPRRDEMTGTLVSRITPTDPERAWQWAATIRVESHRRTAQQAVLSRWRTLDPSAAAKAAGE